MSMLLLVSLSFFSSDMLRVQKPDFFYGTFFKNLFRKVEICFLCNTKEVKITWTFLSSKLQTLRNNDLIILVSDLIQVYDQQ